MNTSLEKSRAGWETVPYLWHLEQMQVIKGFGQPPDHQIAATVPDGTPTPGGGNIPFWDKSAPGTRVAIIDSGCTTQHPNLPADAIYGAIDLASAPDGAVYDKAHADLIRADRASGQDRLRQLLSGTNEQDASDLLDLAQHLIATPLDEVKTADPADYFSGHGTACAGLVAGRKGTFKDADGKPIQKPTVLPYFGVNPFATVVPIATPYSHEIRPLIVALLHAVAVDADVVLMPRAVNDLVLDGTREPGDVTNLRATRLDTDEGLKRDKDLFGILLGAVAAWRPVVLAAGNDGRREPAYPASLVSERPWPGNQHLIVVGAANYLGLRSSYSNGTRSTGVTTYAPSDDEERIDDLGVWYDSTGREGPWVERALRIESPSDKYQPYSVLAIDVPARTFPDAEPGTDASNLPTRALYCRFGGTSAASSLVAGVLSLVQAKRKKEGKAVLTGAEAKRLLLGDYKPLSEGEIGTDEEPGNKVPVVKVPTLMDRLDAGGY